jgi:hypothetical protein
LRRAFSQGDILPSLAALAAPSHHSSSSKASKPQDPTHHPEHVGPPIAHGPLSMKGGSPDIPDSLLHLLSVRATLQRVPLRRSLPRQLRSRQRPWQPLLGSLSLGLLCVLCSTLCLLGSLGLLGGFFAAASCSAAFAALAALASSAASRGVQQLLRRTCRRSAGRVRRCRRASAGPCRTGGTCRTGRRRSRSSWSGS